MRLVARDIKKAFGGTFALDGVSFEVRPGAVHAVLGENGAGKSTLMKIVAGAVAPDAGTLLLDGEPFTPRDPLAARRRGVAIVYQELSICAHLSVAENIVLGTEPNRAGFIERARLRERAARALEPVTAGRAPLPLDLPAGRLAAADQQLVEIARALAQDDCRLLIVDEPTSSLGSDDVTRLFATLGALRERGIAILYISHFLDEVRQIADDFTVLRDGRSVASGRIADTPNDALVEAMAGVRVAAHARRERAPGKVVLALDRLGGERLPVEASLELRSGEVLGIAGLVGSGRTELLRAVFGLDSVKRGEVRVAALSGSASPRERLAQGVGLLSEDRAREGLALGLGIARNLTLSRLAPLRARGLLSPRRERAIGERLMRELGIRARGPEQRTGELSGGNQQKVALGRLLHHDVDVLLLDEPTRGIDVRSRAEIHRVIDALCEKGKAVLVVSSHLEELLALCDRIAVMKKGRLGPPRPNQGLTERDLLREAAGA
ncbi:MAG TPA: sugar ABC transporter ATP-binding protein [Polyangiaceae bacterium]